MRILTWVTSYVMSALVLGTCGGGSHDLTLNSKEQIVITLTRALLSTASSMPETQAPGLSWKQTSGDNLYLVLGNGQKVYRVGL